MSVILTPLGNVDKVMRKRVNKRLRLKWYERKSEGRVQAKGSHDTAVREALRCLRGRKWDSERVNGRLRMVGGIERRGKEAKGEKGCTVRMKRK